MKCKQKIYGPAAALSIMALILSGFLVFSASFSRARMLTDGVGREMQIPDTPKRVVSLAPSITEIVFALDREKRLKGVTRFSDYPPRARKLPSVGSYVHLDIERIVALKPQFCIGIKDGNPIAVVRKLEALNIPVFAVDPKNLAGVFDTILRIGNLLNAEKKAQQIVLNMKTRMNRIQKALLHTDTRPRVFFQIGVSPIVSAGTPTLIHELINLAGGRNLAEGPVPYPRFSREQVLGLSPEVFIITSMARGASFQHVKREWRKWPALPAVKNDRIVLMDSNLCDRPTPRLMDGLEHLAQAIHPELFRKQQP